MFVIGNGESRVNVDVDKLDSPKVGCNAIHRDFFVDHLICVDRKMVQEAIETNYNKTSLLYTRQDWIREFERFPGVRELPQLPYEGTQRWDEPFHWGSGPYAVLLGCLKTLDQTVRLLGFDLYGIDQKVNNVYKDSDNYSNTDSRPVDPRYWIVQIGKLFEVYNDTHFIIYQKQGWQLPELWNRENVFVDDVDKLL
jgi:hypothetical protein